MEADKSRVEHSIKRIKSTIESLHHLSEGEKVVYKGHSFQKVGQGSKGLIGILVRLWTFLFGKRGSDAAIEKAITQLNRDYSEIEGYISQAQAEEAGALGVQLIELKEKYLESDFAKLELPTESDKVNARVRLKTVIDDIDGLVAQSFLRQEVDADKNKDEELIATLGSDEQESFRTMKRTAREKGDLVCLYSQGRIDEKGQAACALIAARGALHVLKGNAFKTEDDIYRVIEQGIDTYKEKNLVGNQTVADALRDTSSELTPIFPEGLQEIDDALVEYFKENPIDYTYQSLVSEGFSAPLEFINGENRVALLNVQKYTDVRGQLVDSTEVKFVFERERTFYLFDSHGKPYQDYDAGASVLKFDTLEECDRHLQEELGGHENNLYTCTFVTTAS